MSFKSVGAAALFRILAAGAVLTMATAVSAPAFANTASVDQVQASQLSTQIVNAVRSAQATAGCAQWNDFRGQRDLKTSLYRGHEFACPVCRQDANGAYSNRECRIEDQASADPRLGYNPQAACQSCSTAVASAVQEAITLSGASPFTAQAALSMAQTQLAADGSMSASASEGFAQVASVVNALAASQTSSTGAGAPSGPAATNSISSPPSSSGGGGYVKH
jgi:hypothetical protein